MCGTERRDRRVRVHPRSVGVMAAVKAGMVTVVVVVMLMMMVMMAVLVMMAVMPGFRGGLGHPAPDHESRSDQSH